MAYGLSQQQPEYQENADTQKWVEGKTEKADDQASLEPDTHTVSDDPMNSSAIDLPPAGVAEGGSERLVELQTLRGLAACVVVIHHCSMAFSTPPGSHEWFDVIFNAHGAVVIFFTLSGYVLSGSLLRSGLDIRAIARFYVRRLCRIYPAVWCASILSLVLIFTLRNLSFSPAPSEWLTLYDRTSFTPMDILKAFLATGNVLIPPIWTVFVEIVGSIVMPILIFLTTRSSKMGIYGFIGALVVLSIAMADARHGLKALTYTIDFAAGILIYLRNPLRSPNSGRNASALILAAGILALTAGRPLYWYALTGDLQTLIYHYGDPYVGLIECAGATALLAALTSGKLRAPVLHARPFVFIGDVSYGLYLLHFPILLAIGKLLGQVLPSGANPIGATLGLTALTLATSVAAAHFVFRYVELPGMAFGRKVI